jgi:hypothetical protein
MPAVLTAAAIGAGASLLGGSMQADASRDAARQSAQAQLESARIAAEAAKFRPVGVTTRYGTSNFQFGPDGYLSGAGYTVSPELKAYQDRLQALTGGALTQAEMAATTVCATSTRGYRTVWIGSAIPTAVSTTSSGSVHSTTTRFACTKS